MGTLKKGTIVVRTKEGDVGFREYPQYMDVGTIFKTIRDQKEGRAAYGPTNSIPKGKFRLADSKEIIAFEEGITNASNVNNLNLIGRHIKALVEMPNSGIVQQGEIGEIIGFKYNQERCEVKFPSQRSYTAEWYNKDKYEILPLDFTLEKQETKRFPEQGFCKSLNKSLVSYLEKITDSTHHKEPQHIGVAWSTGSFWFIAKKSGKPEYQLEDIKHLIPDFMEEIDKDSILIEAKRRYPEGTQYYNASNDTIRQICTRGSAKLEYHKNGVKGKDNITAGDGGSVWFDGKWGEILSSPNIVNPLHGRKIWLNGDTDNHFKLQNKAFELGYVWGGSGEKSVHSTDALFLNFIEYKNKKTIFSGYKGETDLKAFLECPSVALTENDVFSLLNISVTSLEQPQELKKISIPSIGSTEKELRAYALEKYPRGTSYCPLGSSGMPLDENLIVTSNGDLRGDSSLLWYEGEDGFLYSNGKWAEFKIKKEVITEDFSWDIVGRKPTMDSSEKEIKEYIEKMYPSGTLYHPLNTSGKLKLAEVPTHITGDITVVSDAAWCAGPGYIWKSGNWADIISIPQNGRKSAVLSQNPCKEIPLNKYQIGDVLQRKTSFSDTITIGDKIPWLSNYGGANVYHYRTSRKNTYTEDYLDEHYVKVAHSLSEHPKTPYESFRPVGEVEQAFREPILLSKVKKKKSKLVTEGLEFQSPVTIKSKETKNKLVTVNI